MSFALLVNDEGVSTVNVDTPLDISQQVAVYTRGEFEKPIAPTKYHTCLLLPVEIWGADATDAVRQLSQAGWYARKASSAECLSALHYRKHHG